MVSDNPREELWGGGLSRERPPYSERSLPRGRPHRNQGHVALAAVSRVGPTFSILVDGALLLHAATALPRASNLIWVSLRRCALVNRIQLFRSLLHVLTSPRFMVFSPERAASMEVPNKR